MDNAIDEEPLSLLAALRSTVWWIEALCEAADIDPEVTEVKIKVAGGETITTSLSESLARYRHAIGAAGDEADQILAALKRAGRR